MDKRLEKGQSAIEFIFIVGAIAVIILYAFPFVSRHAEINKGIAGARDGAQFGASMSGIGFSSTGGHAPGVIKLESIEYYIQGESGSETVSITINVRGHPELNTNAVKATIGDQAQRYLVKVFTGAWKDISSITATDRTGEYYVFNAINSSSIVWYDT